MKDVIFSTSGNESEQNAMDQFGDDSETFVLDLSDNKVEHSLLDLLASSEDKY